MKHLQMQSRIETAVNEAIEDIAEEFGLDIPSYPEVYWVGRGLDFKSLVLPERYRSFFNYMKKNRHSCYMGEKKIILVGGNDWGDLTEEAAHFLHQMNCKTPKKLNKHNKIPIVMFQEMLGFIGSKVVIPYRQNEYPEEPDLFYLSFGEREKYLNKIESENGKMAADNFYIHQQGYGLGERVFQAYTEKKVSRRTIRDFFKMDLTDTRINLPQLIAKLKIEYWPPKDFRIFF